MAHRTLLDRGTVRRVAIRVLRPGDSAAEDEAEVIVDQYEMEMRNDFEREHLLGSSRSRLIGRGGNIQVNLKGELIRGGDVFGRSIDRGANCDCDDPDACLHALARHANKAEREQGGR